MTPTNHLSEANIYGKAGTAATAVSTVQGIASGTAVAVSGTVSVSAASTATLTNVNDQATNITILALNTSRKGAAVYNDSTSILYLKLGSTATTTSFTVKMQPDDYYEVPAGFTGQIDGIWSADASGAARVTELT